MKNRIFKLTMMISSLLVSAAAQDTWLSMEKNVSTISYDLTHPLHEIHAVSKDADSKIKVDVSKKEIEEVTASVDVMTFDSGNSSRDSHAMEVIDAIDFPEVNFSSTSVADAGDSLRVTGKLSFHGITKDVTIMALAKWQKDEVDVEGNFQLSLTEYKISRPSLLMIPVNDALKFSLHAVYKIG
jgi:polyisoprenoid-binding protein YceI